MNKETEEIIKELPRKSNFFIINPASSLQDNINEIVELLIKKKGYVFIYLSFTRSDEKLEQIFKEKGVGKNKIFCIYFSQKESKSQEKWLTTSIQVPSPAALSSIGIAVSTLARLVKERGILLIDCLTTMLVYNDINVIANFVKSTLESCNKHNMKTIVFTSTSEQKLLEKKVGVFFDKIIEIKGD